MQPRCFLLLQGPHGPFMSELSHELKRRGVRVLRVVFNSGDWWGGASFEAISYRGDADHFGDWIEQLMEKEQVTDLLLYGDCRYYHRQAIEHCRKQSRYVWVLEEGYIRPFWVTLEAQGVNGNSQLPKQFEQWLNYQQITPAELKAAEEHKPVGRGMRGLVIWCHVYYIMRTLGTLFYPRYRSHRPTSYLLESFTWLKKLAKIALGRTRRAEAVADKLAQGNTPFFLVPLQLDADAQVHCHSQYSNMEEFLQDIMRSFKKHAEPDTKLVIKSHPLDSEVRNYERYARFMAGQLGIGERVIFLHGGNLPALLKVAQGTVTVNSTVGLQSIHHGCPTKAMGNAIYDRKGLTAQCSLNDFWSWRSKPDQYRYRLFRYFLLTQCQLNGNFYSGRGRRLLIPQLATRLLSQRALSLVTGRPVSLEAVTESLGKHWVGVQAKPPKDNNDRIAL